jgi:spermidine synthase
MSLLWARVLVFGTSASVLVLEILAGRLMAPYVGVTLETFTGIIGVVLGGIAAGAWLGGWAADQVDAVTAASERTQRRLLGPVLVASGVLVLAAPTIVDALGPSMRAAGPAEIVVLTASAFFLPALLLSTVTPIVVKLRLRSLEETGSVVGSFSAIGTIGALAGTFVTGFVLLAAMPSRSLVVLVGALLVVAGLPLVARAMGKGTAMMGVVLAVGAGSGLWFERGPCEWETTYFCASIQVPPDNPNGRVLWLDTFRNSYVDVVDPTRLEFRYSQVVADVLAERPEGPLHGAYVGGGGFTVPRYVEAVRPGSSSVVFEIDGELVELVERELGLVISEDLRVEVGDARMMLPDEADGSFDYVLGDAFNGLSVPWHLTTREFLVEIDRVLAEDGVYLMNLLDYPPLGFAKAEMSTFLDVWEHVAIVSTFTRLSGERGGNYVLVGSKAPIDWGALQGRITDREAIDYVMADGDAAAFADGARVLTDDFAPVDQLISGP